MLKIRVCIVVSYFMTVSSPVSQYRSASICNVQVK